MADRTATRRGSRQASIEDVEEAAVVRASFKLRLFGILTSLGISAGAIGVAYWQPTQLTERLAPAWEYAGPWLIIAPALVMATYIALRVFGLNNGRVWRWAGATVFGAGAILTALHYFDVTEIRGVTIENGLSAVLADLSTMAVIGIFAGLTLVTLLLVSPLGAFRAARASGRASRVAGAAGANAAMAGGAAAGRGIQNAKSSRASTEEEDGILGQAAVPRTRIVVPEPARTTVRPTYPEPMGVIRDQAKARADERVAATNGGQNRPGAGATQDRPSVIVPGVPSDDEADDATRAYRERYVGVAEPDPGEQSTGDEGPGTAANEQPAAVPPAGMSTANGHNANHVYAHTDAQGESFGMDPHDLGEMTRADPLAIIEDAEEWDSPPPELVEDEDNIWNPEADPALALDENEPIEDVDDVEDLEEVDERNPSIIVADSVQDASADEEAVPARRRSDLELLNSLNPFTGLPRVAWKFPSFKLFDDQPPAPVDTESHLETAEAIQATLQEYGIEVEVTEVRPGPTVTLYGLRPGWDRRYRTVRERDEEGQIVARRQEIGRTRVKVDAIAKLDDDLALQLKAASVRIEPIPSTNLVGVEVPNVEGETVYMRPQLESDVYRKALGKSKLAFPLGKGSGGEPIVADLARMPHLLVAGSTGSGKSVFVNSLITSLITRATPEEIRFVMIDPKRVELTIYNGIPHLITPVIVDTQKVVNALQWMVQQMEDRLELLAQEGARDITSYNEKAPDGKHMPFLVLIVDELADLMMTSGKAVEHGLVRLAQMGRATGIHLVVATQRPSVNVITGLIKANFPTRVSFMVTSLVDSRTILDGAGAEKLLGRGDMLYLPQDASRPIRIQSAFISSHESDAVVDAWRAQSKGYVPPELPELAQPEDIGLQSRGRNGTDSMAESNGAKRNGGNGASGDDIMEQARELAGIYNGKVSTSLLQRRLGIGYPRAARLRDRLVEEGIANAEIPNAPAETAGRGIRRSREQEQELEEA